MTAVTKKRGRPREFDAADALASAGKTFLRHGYSGTSLEVLSAAMKLNKPSIYAAFGDKHALYMSVLEERYRMVAARYQAAFDEGRTLEESLRNVFDDAVDVFAVENRAIVAGRRNAGILDRFLRGGVAAVIEIANRNALNTGNAERGLKMLASADTCADGGEANGIAGRDRPGRCGEQVRLQNVLGDGGRSDRAASDLHELTSGKRRFGHEISALRL